MSGFDYDFQFPDVAHKHLDLSHARRVFIFGDVHGVLENLTNAMAAVNFDPEAGDHAIGVGDWLDRGPDSTKIADFIEASRDWLHFIVGNHEQILWDAGRKGGLDPINLVRNGGQWVFRHIDEESEGNESDKIAFTETGLRIRDVVCKAPVALTVATPGGNTVGCVHAQIPPIDLGGDRWTFDWNEFIERLTATENGEPTQAARELAADAIWERSVLKRIMPKIHYGETAKDAGMVVRGVNHVFHGHSIMDEITTWGNTSWIDIGAYKRGNIAFVEMDEHIHRAATKQLMK